MGRGKYNGIGTDSVSALLLFRTEFGIFRPMKALFRAGLHGCAPLTLESDFLSILCIYI